MKQNSPGLNNTMKRARKREFLDAMERVVLWAELVLLIQPYTPESGRRGHQPFALQILLRYFRQQWFKLSAPAMEKALHGLGSGAKRSISMSIGVEQIYVSFIQKIKFYTSANNIFVIFSKICQCGLWCAGCE